MLTNEDIKNIIEAQREIFLTKKDFVEVGNEIFLTKEEFESFKEELRKDFSDLQTSIDAYAQKADTYFQEMVMLAHKVDKLDKWVHQIAEKVGIKLED